MAITTDTPRRGRIDKAIAMGCATSGIAAIITAIIATACKQERVTTNTGRDVATAHR